MNNREYTMKQSMHLIVRAAIAAAVFTLASGSALAASNLQVIDSHSVSVFTASGGAFGAGSSISPTLWQVKYDSNTFLAFCLDPHVGLSNESNNYSSGAFAASDAAFQLALWELNNDNSNLSTGELRFRSLSNVVVSEGNAMLVRATGSGSIKNLYNYTSLTSVNPASQTLLSVSPVPEAQTWAMLVAGLGLLGFMARRRKGASALT